MTYLKQSPLVCLLDIKVATSAQGNLFNLMLERICQKMIQPNIFRSLQLDLIFLRIFKKFCLLEEHLWGNSKATFAKRWCLHQVMNKPKLFFFLTIFTKIGDDLSIFSFSADYSGVGDEEGVLWGARAQWNNYKQYYGTIRHNTAQYVTICSNTGQYGTIQDNTTQYGKILENTAQYGTIRHIGIITNRVLCCHAIMPCTRPDHCGYQR